ncbi:MAG TPA: NTP transferase domain-containing protein [Methanomicrobiales archaeon]|nr:NTP transferase domain-containing protein [Methanomicrobiales archaeon]
MHALILAGGEGTRLGMGEKPLVTICGRPMVSRVIDAFTSAGLEVTVVASTRTPMTLNYLRAQGIPFYRAMGRGYVDDIIEAVTELGIKAPLFTSVADIPCIRPEHLKRIQEAYFSQDRPALSTWIPRDLCHADGPMAPCTEMVEGVPSVPVGVNILTGEGIREPQDEYKLLLRDPALALNVNTREDLEEARRVMKEEWRSGQDI